MWFFQVSFSGVSGLPARLPPLVGLNPGQIHGRDPEFWFTVSIVPADLFDVGHLGGFRWDLLKDRLRNQIARGPISEPIVLGGIDYDLKHFDDDRPPRWCPHLYLLFSGGGKALVEGTFRRHYLKSGGLERPVVVTSQKTSDQDLVTTATYTFKARFKNRMPSTDARGNADTSTVTLPRWRLESSGRSIRRTCKATLSSRDVAANKEKFNGR